MSTVLSRCDVFEKPAGLIGVSLPSWHARTQRIRSSFVVQRKSDLQEPAAIVGLLQEITEQENSSSKMSVVSLNHYVCRLPQRVLVLPLNLFLEEVYFLKP